MPLTRGSVNSQALGLGERQPACQTGGASRVEGIIKQIACNQLCSPCPGLERDTWLLATATAGAVPEHLLVPGPGGAERKIESKSQVMPSRPSWPPEEGKGLSREWTAGFWALEGCR